jgi:hypothetical protein
MQKWIFFALGLLIWAALSACQAAQAQIVTATPADLPPLQLITEEASPSPEFSPSPSPTASPAPCEALPPEDSRPRYEVAALLEWQARQLQVDQEIRYTNLTGQVLTELVLHVEPNRSRNLFFLQGIMGADTRPIEDFKLETTRLQIPLAEPLGVNCQLDLALAYTLKVPPVITGYEGRLGYFGYTERQMNLGHWIPVVAPFRRDEWQVPRPYVLGEQITPESADFQVRLEVLNAPPTMALAGPGVVKPEGEGVWFLELTAARDLAISMGDGLKRISEVASDGTLIEVYYFPQARQDGFEPPQQALKAAAESLVLYEELFGAEYPYPRLAIVEGDFPDGMEFSGLVYVGSAWFTSWRGEPNEWLTIITVHEVAHQWWYLLVGNNPADYPYMDEALATYSEYLYFQRFYGDLYDWWWDFRVRGYDTAGLQVDAPIYRYDNGRPYINGAYLLGAQMLHTLRLDLGDTAFFAWLRAYIAQNQYGLAYPEDLWGALGPEDYAESQAVRQRFLGDSSILPPTATPTPSPEAPSPLQTEEP